MGEEELYIAWGEIQLSETVPGKLEQRFQAGISGPRKTRGVGQQTMQCRSQVSGGRQSQSGWVGRTLSRKHFVCQQRTMKNWAFSRRQ